ncbi:MAG: response regulator transcription factor [Chitinophagaceae bacterium]
MIQIALADDHVMLRNGLSAILQSLGFGIAAEASNGQELIDKLRAGLSPQIVLMDINMPLMNGYDATAYIHEHFPLIHVLALSMYDDEPSIIRMLKNGARGYVLKESEPAELKLAINGVLTKGFHYSDIVTGSMLHSIDSRGEEMSDLLNLSDREVEFLKFSGTELTYKEIASKMYLSPRTIDGYRDSLFEKLNIHSRVGLVLFAIKNKIILVN